METDSAVEMATNLHKKWHVVVDNICMDNDSFT